MLDIGPSPVHLGFDLHKMQGVAECTVNEVVSSNREEMHFLFFSFCTIFYETRFIITTLRDDQLCCD